MASHWIYILATVAVLAWSQGCAQRVTYSEEGSDRSISNAMAQDTPLRRFERITPESLADIDPATAAHRMQERRLEPWHAVAAGLRDVYFPYDSATLTETGMSTLDVDAEWLLNHADTTLRIEGHCDERGSAAYNLVLGEKRALAVRSYLMELGIPAQRVTAISYGEEHPLCFDQTEACYQVNRRGHLAVTR